MNNNNQAEAFRIAFAKFCLDNGITEAVTIFERKEDNKRSSGVCQFSTALKPHPAFTQIHDQLNDLLQKEYARAKSEAN